MAMCIEKLGIDLAAIYRPLNNIFKSLMEDIKKNIFAKIKFPKAFLEQKNSSVL